MSKGNRDPYLRFLICLSCASPCLALGSPLAVSRQTAPGCTFADCAAGLCECSVPTVYLQRWTDVLREYAVRYGTRVSGWWVDGCFRRPYSFNESSLKPFHDAVRAGNEHALVGFNNGVHHPIGAYPDRISKWEDYTTGESDDFTEVRTHSPWHRQRQQLGTARSPLSKGARRLV